MSLTQRKSQQERNCEEWNKALKPAIVLRPPEKTDQGKHNKKSNVALTPVMQIAPPTRSPWPTRKWPGAWLGRTWLAKQQNTCWSGNFWQGFNHSATSHSNKSIANYTRCISAVTLGFPPRNPSKTRKDGWDNFWRNQETLLVRDYIARGIKINDYLEEFPSVIVGRNATKLPGDKLLD